MLLGMRSPPSSGSIIPPTDNILLWWDNTLYWGEANYLMWG